MDWDPAGFDWALKDSDAQLNDPRGGIPVFTAGLWASLQSRIADGPVGAGWLEELNARQPDPSLHFVRTRDDRERLVRVAYPEEVLVGRTIDQQAESLGAWIVASFDTLVAAKPPGTRA